MKADRIGRRVIVVAGAAAVLIAVGAVTAGCGYRR